MKANYGACKDGVVVLNEVTDLEVHHPFNGISTGCCILVENILLIYDLPSDYYNKMSPVHSLCIKNCILNLEQGEIASPSGNMMRRRGSKGKINVNGGPKPTFLLGVANSINKLVLGFDELFKVKEFVDYIYEASNGSNNAIIFLDDVVNPAITALDRMEYLKRLQESGGDMKMYEDAPQSSTLYSEEGPSSTLASFSSNGSNRGHKR